MDQRRLRAQDPYEREREAFYERMRSADRCPIAGPCHECGEAIPHRCSLAAILRWEPRVPEALALALDSIIYGENPREPLPEQEALEILLGRLCGEHRRLVEERKRRPCARTERTSRDLMSGAS